MADFLQSLGSFLWGIIKRSYYWLPAFLLDPFDIYNKFLRPFLFAESKGEANIPVGWFPYVLSGLILWAAFLTYHEVHGELGEVQIINDVPPPFSVEASQPQFSMEWMDIN